MKVLWSTTQPAEPGWYYCRDSNDEPQAEFIGRYRGDDRWELPGVSGTIDLNRLLRIGIEFGPPVQTLLEYVSASLIIAEVLALVDKIRKEG